MFLIGFPMIFEYFLIPDKPPSPSLLKDAQTVFAEIRNFGAVIAAGAITLGSVILTLYHSRQIYRKRKGEWPFSIVYWIFFFLATVFGVFTSANVKDPSFLWLYNWISVPAGSALYSTTAFYITSAAFRAFRARTLESAILLLSGAVLVMMAVPFFGVIPYLTEFGSWIMDVPGGAGFRGFIIGVALGSIGLGLRVFLGRQKEVLGIPKEE